MGAVTAGGANPGGLFRLNEHFAAFIATGRAINPVTKTNWEGVGVQPDVAVKPEDAVREAHVKAITALLEKPRNDEHRALLQRALNVAQQTPSDKPGGLRAPRDACGALEAHAQRCGRSFCASEPELVTQRASARAGRPSSAGHRASAAAGRVAGEASRAFGTTSRHSCDSRSVRGEAVSAADRDLPCLRVGRDALDMPPACKYRRRRFLAPSGSPG